MKSLRLVSKYVLLNRHRNEQEQQQHIYEPVLLVVRRVNSTIPAWVSVQYEGSFREVCF